MSLKASAFYALLSGLLAPLLACMPTGPELTLHQAAIADAAGPILTMSPDAVWTDCYNRLLESGPESIAYLAEQPIMHRPAAPDDLRVMLHSSLIRLLADPSVRPVLSATCFETTFDLLHFDIKSRAHRIGTVWLPDGRVPPDWHDLYPADYDRGFGDLVDAEADRQAICDWWRAWRQRGEAPPLARPLRPRPADAFRVLPRRYADIWLYVPQSRSILCSYGPPEGALFSARTRDYNLVRAACLWLGYSAELEIRDRLIEMVGDPSPRVAHNAMLALSYSPDARIRDLLERYNKPDPAPACCPGRRPAGSEDEACFKAGLTEIPA